MSRQAQDDARHITVDRGRRTLCGQLVTGDPGGFYLPLGKAPRTDEGGAWCWTCLTVQDDAAAFAARLPEGLAATMRDLWQSVAEHRLYVNDVYAEVIRRLCDGDSDGARDALRPLLDPLDAADSAGKDELD